MLLIIIMLLLVYFHRLLISLDVCNHCRVVIIDLIILLLLQEVATNLDSLV